MQASWLTGLALAFAWAGNAVAAQPTPKACEGMLPDPALKENARPVEPADLLRLRDIGYMHPAPGQPLFALAPDRKQLAFVMHRADPLTDRYCAALLVLHLVSGHVQILESGDDLLMERVEIRGMEVDYGLPRTILPQWSSDGRHLAYLRKVDGLAQIIDVELATGQSRQISHSSVGVDYFARVEGDKAYVYSDRPARNALLSEIAVEGDTGYLFDDRILPYTGTKPAIRSPLPPTFHIIGADGRSQDGTAKAARLEHAKQSESPQLIGGRPFVSGWSLAKRQRLPGSYASPTQIVAIDPKGLEIICPHPACRGSLLFDIEGAWETDRPGEFAYLRREGWAGSKYGLYLWQAGNAPRRLLSTEDMLLGCQSVGSKLVCARENALRPRHLVSVDLRHQAAITELFDPNPGYRNLRQARVERLHWRNDQGQESFGDLILPLLRKDGGKVPLVVVQYISRGFLRGGTGDEYPIQALARNGFAVLSFHKPSALFAVQAHEGGTDSVSKRLNEDWADRSNTHSSLTRGIAQVLARGDIDQARIGITGVSDGSTTVQYALINSPGLFKAASIGSCCVDPTAMLIYGGSALARERTAWGYPPVFGPGSERWRPLALSQNPALVMPPMLMQLADNEFLIAMETLAAYQKAGRPVEARIFPDEHHLKSGPRHRLAVYCRNLRWFGFWLEQPIAQTSCPSDPVEDRRWTDMRMRAAKPD